MTIYKFPFILFTICKSTQQNFSVKEIFLHEEGRRRALFIISLLHDNHLSFSLLADIRSQDYRYEPGR